MSVSQHKSATRLAYTPAARSARQVP
jgi:hypothetical protein